MLLLLTISTISILIYKPIDEKSITVVVEENLVIDDEYISFETSYNNDKYLVYIYEDLEIEYGSIILLEDISIDKITNSYNNPSSFDYEQYMLGNGIGYTISSENSQETGNKKNVFYKIKNTRDENITYNEENIKNYEYINALVYGENNFEDEEYDTFAELNILHAITISGSHLTLIIAFIRVTFSIMRIKTKTIDVALLAFLPIYCILAGGAIPIVRATLLELGVIIFGKKINRKDMTLIILILFCIINPFTIFLVSFQLTFLISFLLFIIDNYVSSNNFIIRTLQTSFWISFFILPITINLNYQINFLSPIANLILVPLISFVILPLCFLIEVFPLFTNILPYILNLTIIIFEKVAHFFSLFTMTTGNIEPIMSILIVCCGLMYGFNKKTIYLATSITLVLLLPINFNIIGSVNFVDVGQGDFIFIELPFNQGNIIIDNGPKDASEEVENYLMYNGVRTIDMMFLTHDHADHVSNSEMIVQNFHVKHVYGSQGVVSNINTEVLKAGDTIKYRGYEFEILYPEGIEENPNNNSLVIKVKLGFNTFLFTGDIESIDEQYILEHYDVNSTILKVPHHGSNSSSTNSFLSEVSPQVCIISVAEQNMYNHPNPLTIDRLEQNCEIKATSENGEIKYRFIALRSN